MPWITDSDLRQRVLDLIGKADFEEPSTWDTVIADANRDAAGDIVAALAVRGYSAAQINQWDRRQDFNVDLGLFWALTRGGATKNFDDRFIKSLDRRQELAKIQVTTGGEAVTPARISGVFTIKPLAEQCGEVFTAKRMNKW